MAFVRERLKARDSGADLRWEDFSHDHRPTWNERRREIAERAYRAAALSYIESRYDLAVSYGALAVLARPTYTLRRAYRQRFKVAGC
jgi:hypothetical protein